MRSERHITFTISLHLEFCFKCKKITFPFAFKKLKILICYILYKNILPHGSLSNIFVIIHSLRDALVESFYWTNHSEITWLVLSPLRLKSYWLTPYDHNLWSSSLELTFHNLRFLTLCILDTAMVGCMSCTSINIGIFDDNKASS
jgi:hypothetical protein